MVRLRAFETTAGGHFLTLRGTAIGFNLWHFTLRFINAQFELFSTTRTFWDWLIRYAISPGLAVVRPLVFT